MYCDHGKPLANALRNASPGDTIVITGTCTERVTITTDQITLDGQGQAIIDGQTAPENCKFGKPQNPEAIEGQVEIDGAKGVVLTGFTVQNSPVDGMFFRGSAATLRNITVKNSCDDGIDSEQAQLTLENSHLNTNGENGMNLSNTSTANIFVGTVTFSDNARFGIQNQHSLVFSSTGAFLEASGNGFIGIGVFAGGEVIGYTGSHITVDNNAAHGFLVIGGGLSVSYANVEVNNNGQSNEADDGGITLVDGSVFSLTGGYLTVDGNQPVGLAADDSTVSLRLAENPNDFSVTQNGPPDVALTFGTRATLMGSIGTIFCDGTELIRGLACTTTP